MIKLVAGTLAAFVLGLGGVAAAQTFTGDDPPEPRSVSVGTTTNDTTTGTTTLDDTVGTTTNDTPGDISGPCDEAEHANDPRCTGVGTVTGDDDRRGRGRDNDEDDGDRGHNRGHGGGDDDEDRSGSNSGRG